MSQMTVTYGYVRVIRDGRAAHAPWAPDEGCKEPSYLTDRTADEWMARRSHVDGGRSHTGGLQAGYRIAKVTYR